MNFREWILPLTFAISLTFLIQYFMGPQVSSTKETEGLSGQSFIAPELKQAQKPLGFDVQFDTKEEKEVSKHVVTTDLGIYTFSSKGAVLDSLEFFWQGGKKNVQMLDAGQNCFLIGLSGKSPLYYTFDKEYKFNNQKIIAVDYKAPFEGGTITKTFMIHQDTYQIDVQVSVDYHQKNSKKAEQVRLFFPMPLTIQDGGGDEVKAFKNKVSRADTMALQYIDLNKQAKEFIFEPKAFGFSNKFVVQGFVKALENKPLRGYFKPLDSKQYDAVLESSVLEKDKQFTWSFYFGPKIETALKAVDPYLVQTLDYGWFTFIAKPMLALLNIFKDYLGNYGWAIILLTILLKLLMLPFMLKGEKSVKQQAEMKKKLAYIKQKYKHDKEALDRATAELIQKHGVPQISACLPLFLNFPFFIALNRILSGSIALHGASFLWIPDLSACDPYYVLGVLTGICLLLTPMGDDSKVAMRSGSAIFFGTITMYFSAGLALFIFVSTLMTLLQAIVTRGKYSFFSR